LGHVNGRKMDRWMDVFIHSFIHKFFIYLESFTYDRYLILSLRNKIQSDPLNPRCQIRQTSVLNSTPNAFSVADTISVLGSVLKTTDKQRLVSTALILHNRIQMDVLDG
jgi:hypothetical protein